MGISVWLTRLSVFLFCGIAMVSLAVTVGWVKLEQIFHFLLVMAILGVVIGVPLLIALGLFNQWRESRRQSSCSDAKEQQS